MNENAWSRKIIVPAAGFGRRVGSPEAKEMFIDPKTGRPLIERAVALGKKLNVPVLVITRTDKQNLLTAIEAYKGAGSDIEVLLISPTREWPETLLKSEPFWAERNLVVLPDTVWAPEGAAGEMFELLEKFVVAYATFASSSDNRFGFVSGADNKTMIWEKPKIPPPDSVPWGLIGFQKNWGARILGAHLDSTITNQPQTLEVLSGWVSLDSFCDLTRG